MECEWLHDEIVELINLYETSQLLWLPSCADYKDKDKKRARETEIAAKLQKTVQEVQKKWQNLRTQFLKEYNGLKKKLPSGSGVDPSKVKWKFFRDLFFLAATVQSAGSRRCNLQISGEASQSVSGEASQSVTEEDTGEVGSDSEQQQSHAQQQSAQPTTQPTPSTSRGPTKKRRKGDEEEAIAAIGQYFTSKTSKPSAAVPPATADDDVAFGTVIGIELKKIKTPWIKREVKKQLMEAVFNGQEQEEQQQVLQQQVLQLVVSAETAQPPTQLPSSTKVISTSDAQLLPYIQQQQHVEEQQQILQVPASAESEEPQTGPTSSTGVISMSDAQLLLHMQQQ